MSNRMLTIASTAALWLVTSQLWAHDWPSHGGDSDETGYSTLSEVTSRNVGRLGLAWSLDLEGEQSLEATPLAVDGRLYFTGSYSTVYCVDARSGRRIWTYDPEIHKHSPWRMRMTYAVNRGAAYSKGMLFTGTLDGRLLAFDALNGTLLWSVATVDEKAANTITGAPRVFNDKVLIGNGGADARARGYVTAYDTKTGKQVWRFYTVPDNPAVAPQDDAMQMAAKTWGGEWWKVGGGGGTVWDSMTYDRELNRVYIGVGNSGPYDPQVRSPGGGDNLFIASIVALDADSGKYIWHYQVNPREAWDYKATARMIAATIAIDGRRRRVLMQSPTNGFFYVLDRDSGQLISAEKIGKVTWAERIDLKTGRPVEAPNIRYESGPVTIWPSPYGAHNWQAMTYNPRTRLVYIPTMQLGARYTPPTSTGNGAERPAARLGGVAISPVVEDAEDGTGALLAWDPVAQRARWRVKQKSMWNGGTLTTAGALVFQGNAEGLFEAYDARTGERRWSFDAKLGIIAAPISYSVRGRQQISVLVGYGGASGVWSSMLNRGWKYGLQPRRLLTFALGGNAQLPPTPPPDFAVHALDKPQLVIDADAAEKGAAIYGACAGCHGSGLLSAGAPAPDLRESAQALEETTFNEIVKNGALMSRGMPQYSWLTDDQVHSLYMYIRAGAREALKRSPSP